MVQDLLRGYVQIASGLTTVTRQRATATAKSMADDLMQQSAANRELLRGVVAAEVERAWRSVGLAERADVEALQRTIQRLTVRVEKLEARATPASDKPRATKSPRKSGAKK